MASSYPGGYDSLAKPTATTKEDDAGFEHDIVHTDEANAIEAVQSTLGLNPEGGSVTVKARLDAVDTSLSGKVGTSDSRLTDARTPTAHASSHGSAGSDAITIAPSQVTGTAVVTSDSRLTDSRTPTAHAASHGSAGSDPITVAQSQVTNLTTDLSGKIAASLVDAKGDLIVGTADDTVGRLASSATNGEVLTVDTSTGTGLKWASAAAGGYSTVYNRQQSFVSNRVSSGTTRTISAPTGGFANIVVGDTVVINIGNASYDGTFTVATKPNNSTITYTAGTSLTEASTAAGGTAGWTRAVTQRNDLTIAGAATASDLSSRTQLLIAGRMDATPATANFIYPALTSLVDSSYTSYQTMKATPIYLAEAGVTYQTITVKVNASSSVGDIRFGVYTSSFDFSPHRLVQDFGTVGIIGIGAPFNQNKSISWTVPEAGLYWLVMCLQTSNAASPSVTQGTVQPYTNLAQDPSSYEVASVTGAFAVAPFFQAAVAPTLAPAISLKRS